MNLFDTVSNHYSYKNYIALTETLVAQKKTSGPEQSEERIGYTKLNLQRMYRWEKTFKVKDELAAISKMIVPQIWWVITEVWCGDSAQIVTQLAGIAESSNGRIEIRFLLRDEHPAIIDKYLTNGNRAIPKLVAVDLEGKVLFTWGPRPAGAQKIINEWKLHPGERSYEDVKREVHLWYAKNQGEEVQEELLKKLGSLRKEQLA